MPSGTAINVANHEAERDGLQAGQDLVDNRSAGRCRRASLTCRSLLPLGDPISALRLSWRW